MGLCFLGGLPSCGRGFIRIPNEWGLYRVTIESTVD